MSARRNLNQRSPKRKPNNLPRKKSPNKLKLKKSPKKKSKTNHHKKRPKRKRKEKKRRKKKRKRKNKKESQRGNTRRRKTEKTDTKNITRRKITTTRASKTTKSPLSNQSIRRRQRIMKITLMQSQTHQMKSLSSRKKKLRSWKTRDSLLSESQRSKPEIKKTTTIVSTDASTIIIRTMNKNDKMIEEKKIDLIQYKTVFFHLSFFLFFETFDFLIV